MNDTSAPSVADSTVTVFTLPSALKYSNASVVAIQSFSLFISTAPTISPSTLTTASIADSSAGALALTVAVAVPE